MAVTSPPALTPATPSSRALKLKFRSYYLSILTRKVTLRNYASAIPIFLFIENVKFYQVSYVRQHPEQLIELLLVKSEVLSNMLLPQKL